METLKPSWSVAKGRVGLGCGLNGILISDWHSSKRELYNVGPKESGTSLQASHIPINVTIGID